jgi:hypothetical protein
MKNFNVQIFFSCFCIARANQNNRFLALGGASRKGGGNGMYCDICSAKVYAVSANGQKMVSKRHSHVYRIETTIKSDINVSITPPFLQWYLFFVPIYGNAFVHGVQKEFRNNTTSANHDTTATPLHKIERTLRKLFET